MPSQDDAFARHQQARWMRPDAARWVRPDAARYLAPGMDVTRAYPALALKYSPNQPRVPAGNPDGGQWTDADGGWGDAQAQAAAASSGRPRVIIDTTNLGKPLSQDERAEIDALVLFGITPQQGSPRGIQLAGDPPGIGDNGGPPLDEPPEIPKKMPTEPGEAMKFVRAAAQWIARVGLRSSVASSFLGAAEEVEELKRLTDMIKTVNDPPRDLEELIERAQGPSRPGYHRHHLAEQGAARRDGFPESMIEGRDNVVSVPHVKHIDITADYMRIEQQPDGTMRSLRDYLADKDFETRQSIGRAILRKRGVLR